MNINKEEIETIKILRNKLDISNEEVLDFLLNNELAQNICLLNNSNNTNLKFIIPKNIIKKFKLKKEVLKNDNKNNFIKRKNFKYDIKKINNINKFLNFNIEYLLQTKNVNNEKLAKKINKQINLFIASNIFPYIIDIFSNEKKVKYTKNNHQYNYIKTNKPYILSDYYSIGDFLLETFYPNDINLHYVSNIEDSLEEYIFKELFNILISNKSFDFHLIDSNFMESFYQRVMKKIYSLKIKELFLFYEFDKDILLYNNLLKLERKERLNIIHKSKMEKFFLKEILKKDNLIIYIKGKYLDIKLNLMMYKDLEFELTKLLIEDLYEKIKEKETDFIFVENTKNIINHKIVSNVYGWNFNNNAFTKLNKKKLQSLIPFNKNKYYKYI